MTPDPEEVDLGTLTPTPEDTPTEEVNVPIIDESGNPVA